jgi:hypothetical protein
MRCMNAFSKVMERLTSVQEDAVIDPSDLELAHMLDEHERMAAKERAFFEQRLAAQPKPQPASGFNTRIPF